MPIMKDLRASLSLDHDFEYFIVSSDITDKLWTAIGLMGHLFLCVP